MPKQPRAGHRSPDMPTQLPPRGWWDILRRTARDVSRHHLADEAGGIAFFALLALAPALTALVSLYGLFADPSAIAGHLDVLAAVAPDGGMRVIGDYVRRLAMRDQGTLGFGAAGGIAVALWSVSRAMRTLFRVLNLIHGERENRSFLTRIVLTLAFTLGGLLFALLAMGAVIALPLLLSLVGLGRTADLLHLARWPLLLGAVTMFLACIYRYGPCRAKPRWRWVSWGGAFAALAWLLGSAALSWYVGDLGGDLGRKSRTYEPLGAVIGFMTWLWLTAIVVLVGAALNAEMEHEAEGPSGS